MALDSKALSTAIQSALQSAFPTLVFPGGTGSSWDAITQAIVKHLQTNAQPGRVFLNRQTFNASGTYKPTTGTTCAILRAVGGGGGGGGATGGASAVAAGAGGSSGVYIEKLIDGGTVLLAGGDVIIGTAGPGGSSVGGTGGGGGDTKVTINGVTYLARGGAGGVGMLSGASNGNASPSAPASDSGPFDITTYGLGGVGVRLANNAWWSGSGGASPLCPGALSVGGSNAGSAPPFANGGGGGSGASATTVNLAGGNGAAGQVVIDEFGYGSII